MPRKLLFYRYDRGVSWDDTTCRLNFGKASVECLNTNIYEFVTNIGIETYESVSIFNSDI